MFTKDNASEFGKRGGAKNKANHANNPHYFASLGTKGGAAMLEKRGPEFFAKIGRLGKRRQKKS